MAAALECWSSRTSSTDEDMVEQGLMRTGDRSESSTAAVDGKDNSTSLMQKKLQKLSRNVSEAIASLKNSLNLDPARDSNPTRIDSCRKHVWGSVVRNLTQLYPGSQLPEKLVSNIRKHYDSLPLSYAEAGFEMKDVFLHVRLIEQASSSGDDNPVIMIQEVDNNDDQIQASLFNLTFACNSSFSWPAMSGSLDSSSISCKKIHIFEKKGFTLGVILLLVQPGHQKIFKSKIENALKSALLRKPTKTNSIKLPFGLCGSQEEPTKGIDFEEIQDQSQDNSSKIKLQLPLSTCLIVISVDEWQTVQSGADDIKNWLLNPDSLEFVDQVGVGICKGTYKGRKVGIEKLKGCDKGNSYEFEIRKDLLELMTCGHKNILQFYGVCIDDVHGLCVVNKLMEGGSLHDRIMAKNKKKIQTKEIVRIATDVAEGIKFMNDHGIVYRDINTHRILLDKNGNACLGDMGIVSACKNAGDAMDYETDGYRWLAPEIIAGDPESVRETWMSNVFSFGMVVWEMVTGEAAYSALSPVQAAVGIAACGLRPDIPKDCPQQLRSLMNKCWNNTPSKRPSFSEIISLLAQLNNNNNSSK